MQVLTRAGVSLPDQVSVTGFDDSRVAQLSSVDLTTVRQDPVEMGDAAVEAAVRRVGRSAVKPTEFVIMPTLIARGSTALPRSDGAKRRSRQAGRVSGVLPGTSPTGPR
jgi:DNA-binding LacI/PurR family transcriptional regulator